MDVAEVARRLLSGAVELGGARIASEAVGSARASAIEITLVRAKPRRRRNGRGS